MAYSFPIICDLLSEKRQCITAYEVSFMWDNENNEMTNGITITEKHNNQETERKPSIHEYD